MSSIVAPADPIFVVGAGPLVNSYVARYFAAHSFSGVALTSRRFTNLSRDVSFEETVAHNFVY